MYTCIYIYITASTIVTVFFPTVQILFVLHFLCIYFWTVKIFMLICLCYINLFFILIDGYENAHVPCKVSEALLGMKRRGDGLVFLSDRKQSRYTPLWLPCWIPYLLWPKWSLLLFAMSLLPPLFIFLILIIVDARIVILL